MASDLNVWPSWMPIPEQDSYKYEVIDRRTKTDMEVGTLQRVNFDTDETTLECKLTLDRCQAAWLENFERKTLRQGTRWFLMPLQTGGFIDFHTVRFASHPKATQIIGAGYTVYTLRLDVQWRIGAMCDELAGLLVCVPPQEVIESSETIKDFLVALPNTCTVPDFWIYCRSKRIRYEYGM